MEERQALVKMLPSLLESSLAFPHVHQLLVVESELECETNPDHLPMMSNSFQPRHPHSPVVKVSESQESGSSWASQASLVLLPSVWLEGEVQEEVPSDMDMEISEPLEPEVLDQVSATETSDLLEPEVIAFPDMFWRFSLRRTAQNILGNGAVVPAR